MDGSSTRCDQMNQTVILINYLEKTSKKYLTHDLIFFFWSHAGRHSRSWFTYLAQVLRNFNGWDFWTFRGFSDLFQGHFDVCPKRVMPWTNGPGDRRSPYQLNCWHPLNNDLMITLKANCKLPYRWIWLNLLCHSIISLCKYSGTWYAFRIMDLFLKLGCLDCVSCLTDAWNKTLQQLIVLHCFIAGLFFGPYPVYVSILAQ